MLYLLAKQVPRLRTDDAFGSNGYGGRSPVGIGAGGAFLAEVLLTFLLVFVFLMVTQKVTLTGIEPVPVGLALAAVNLVGIPLTWTSVNPARSLGPALFAGGGALSQLWVFLIAPLVGGVLAAVVHRFTHLHPAGQAERSRPRSRGPARGGGCAADTAPRRAAPRPRDRRRRDPRGARRPAPERASRRRPGR